MIVVPGLVPLPAPFAAKTWNSKLRVFLSPKATTPGLGDLMMVSGVVCKSSILNPG